MLTKEILRATAFPEHRYFFLVHFFTAGQAQFPPAVKSFLPSKLPSLTLVMGVLVHYYFSIPTKLPTPLSRYRARALGGLRYSYGGYKSGYCWRATRPTTLLSDLTCGRPPSPVPKEPLERCLPPSPTLSPCLVHPPIMNHALPNIPSFPMPTKGIHGSCWGPSPNRRGERIGRERERAHGSKCPALPSSKPLGFIYRGGGKGCFHFIPLVR
jgi:hypothetical protein